jgi:hypothetical protein
MIFVCLFWFIHLIYCDPIDLILCIQRLIHQAILHDKRMTHPNSYLNYYINSCFHIFMAGVIKRVD